jgi:hypothetical protein
MKFELQVEMYSPHRLGDSDKHSKCPDTLYGRLGNPKSGSEAPELRQWITAASLEANLYNSLEDAGTERVVRPV